MLVPTNRLAALVDDALERAGVPAVINGAGSVFATPAADEWLRLLEALERPVSATRARSAALTSFLGWSAERDGRRRRAGLGGAAREAAPLGRPSRRRGVAALLDSISATEAVPRRVLARLGGERRLTDLGHVGQLLHTAATEQQLGVSSLTAWLRQRIADADRDSADEDRALRLDSDAEAVQVLTIHRSKGLEFPIVYHPFAWQPGYIDEDEPPAYHDDQNDDAWTIDVGGKTAPTSPGTAGSATASSAARTSASSTSRSPARCTRRPSGGRARTEASNSALGRLLFARDADGVVAAEGTRTPDDDEVAARLEALAAQAPGRIAVETGRGAGGRALGGRAAPARRARREHVRAHARRPLATGLVQRHRLRRARGAGGDASPRSTSSTTSCSRPRRRPTRRRRPTPRSSACGRHRRRSPPCPAAPTSATSSTACWRRPTSRAPTSRPSSPRAWPSSDAAATSTSATPTAAIAGLAGAIETPLGPLLDEMRLRDVAAADRLDELGFELPLVGGDTPTGTLALSDVASLLETHLPADDPLRRLRRPPARPARALGPARLPDRDARPRPPHAAPSDGSARYALVDYKSNWLGADGEELSAWHYRPAALAEAMQRAHYPLQALLYLAALHRYLRGAAPRLRRRTRHLAGVLYLFLRGMTGPATPRVDGQPCGVFAWRPPAPLVEALSDLLDRGGDAT